MAGAIVAAAVVVPIYSLGGDSKPEVRAFVGTWTSVDEDRSNQALRVTHRPEAESYYLTLEDDAATACSGASVTGEGTGTVVGNRLSGTLRLSCASGARLQFSWWVIYSSADDTLVDKEGVVWSRTKKPPTDGSSLM